MKPDWTERDHATWREILKVQAPRRTRQTIPMFWEGLEILGFSDDHIPDLDRVNAKLHGLTGWEGVYVKGLEGGESFYAMLADRKFPIGCFIRDKSDLNYTPEPDVVHDLYGHIPFLANSTYADFSQKFAARAMKFIRDPERFKQFERLYWFTMEFGLIKTAHGRRIFGAGILSSIKECEFSLSSEPIVKAYDPATVREQDFRIDQIQTVLFELESESQLYNSLDKM